MMEREEIIQQKVWIELNDSEKVIIQDIAASEQEFNLMKKIFLVSKEELLEVPEIDPQIEHVLQGHIIQSHKKKYFTILYAAAAISIILLTLFFILNNNKTTENPLVKTEIPKQSNPDTAKTNFVQQKNSVIDSNIVLKEIPFIKEDKIQKQKVTVYHTQDMAVNTTVAFNINLLDYVTELN